MNGCGCNYWKELIKSAWGLATTSVRAVKTKTDTKYPDGDGLIDLSDITGGGGEGTVTSVNGKEPDTQGNVVIGSGDIATPDGTVQGDIEELGTNLASEISARASGDETLQTAVDGKQDALTSAQLNAVNSGITKDKVTNFSMTSQNLIRLGNRVDTIEDDVATKQPLLTAGDNITISEDNVISATGGGSSGVSSVNGNTGAVTIGASDVLTTAQLNAANSGITASKVTAYDGYSSKITALEGDMTSVEDSVSTLGTQIGTVDTKVDGKQDKLSTAQTNAVNSGITSAKVSTYDGYASGKQNTLSTAQLNAANSGITSAKVSTYDGYASGKQDKLTAGTNIQISGNTISATDTKYTLPTASSSVLGGVKVGSGLSISNGVLSATGGGGGGGASLPENGYYWEKLTEWSWDWTPEDIIMVYCPKVQDGNASSWTDSITYEGVADLPHPIIVSLESTSSIPYYYNDVNNCITVNYAFTYGELVMNNDDYSTVLDLNFSCFNGKEHISHYIYSYTRDELIDDGIIYRLRKFSS